MEEVGARGRQIRDQGCTTAEGEADEQSREGVARFGDPRQRQDHADVSKRYDGLNSARGAQTVCGHQPVTNEIFFEFLKIIRRIKF